MLCSLSKEGMQGKEKERGGGVALPGDWIEKGGSAVAVEVLIGQGWE